VLVIVAALVSIPQARTQSPLTGMATSKEANVRKQDHPADTNLDAYPPRCVLEDVPRVAYHTDRWRFTPFCNALDACLRYLGEEEQYDYLMAVSGAGFRTTWGAHMWDGGNSDILGMAAEPLEPMRRAFWAAGYAMEPVAKAVPEGWPEDILHESARRLGGALTDEMGFRRHIVDSISRRNVPVIAFGIIGPPEAAVITGYGEGGDVLIGWSVFQEGEGIETEPSGYFRVRDWYPRTRGLLLVGDKTDPPPGEALHRSTLLWALEVLRRPLVRKHASGLAAFDAWASDMGNDNYFPVDKKGVLRGRLNCHYDAMGMQAERATAASYLSRAAQDQPVMAAHLRSAAAALEEGGVEHGVRPNEQDQINRLADPVVRHQVAESILATQEAYHRAAGHIEQALIAAGVAPADIPRFGPMGDTAPAETRREGPDQRMVLNGVPKVGFGMIDGQVQMTPFPACLRACLEYIGDDLGFAHGKTYPRNEVYTYLMGVTGAAFRLNWKPGWHGDNVAGWLVSNDPSEISRRGFAGAGYQQIATGHVPNAEKEERLRRLVIESIRDRALPVIAHGVIGPPEEAIIAGYDEGGRVAIGWSFFQSDVIGKAGVEFEPNGYFRKRRWEADTWSMMAIGDQIDRPPRRQAYINGLQWALHVVRDPVRYGDRHNGLAAYDAWAEHILRDDVAAEGGPDDAFMVHSDAVDVIAEGRHYAAGFLRQAAQVLTTVREELEAAATCYRKEHDLMWEIWGLVGSNQRGEAQREAFLKPDIRRRIAPIIRAAREQDRQAADLIEQALGDIGVTH